MDITDLIVEEILKAPERERETEKNEALAIIRSRPSPKAKLTSQEFGRLVKAVEAAPEETLGTANLGKKEQEMLCTAISKGKFARPDDLIIFLCRAETKLAPVFLASVLAKRYRITEAEGHLAEYVDRMITRDTLLCHLKILCAVSRHYPRLVSPAVLRFCGEKAHPICKQILQDHAK